MNSITTTVPRKREDRNKWDITYRIPGYDKVYFESFDSFEEANYRAAEINLAKKRGVLRPPARGARRMPTLAEYLEEYVSVYGSGHWGDSQYSEIKHHIHDYILPDEISRYLLKDIRTKDLDAYYQRLLETPAVLRPGHADRGKKVGISVIEKIHRTLRAAMTQAVKWEYLTINPAIGAAAPKVEHEPRKVWSPSEAQEAINLCTDDNLRICILLAISCSLRIGEILGLQWDCINITTESLSNNTSTVTVKQELKRCEKDTLSVLEAKGRSSVFYKFPPFCKNTEDCKTVLTLKTPKTKSSRRTVYISNSVATELQRLKDKQELQKQELHGLYEDYNLVVAQPTGRPTEERLIAKAFKDLIKENDLPEVVFHSLRHLSTSMKLQLSGGDIKAVQGDTGHAQSAMVTQVYSHTFNEDRKRVADLMETRFFSPTMKPNPDSDDKLSRVLILLSEKPELANLLLAMA